ncbi:hypothetical protein P4S72_27780 [Vibrio sp. PP-XX7]
MRLKIQLPESILLALENGGSLRDIEAYAQFDHRMAVQQMIPIRYKEHSRLASAGTQTYEMTFVLKPSGQLHLLPGMSASVAIHMPVLSTESAPIAILPLTAIVRRPIRKGRVTLFRMLPSGFIRPTHNHSN